MDLAPVLDTVVVEGVIVLELLACEDQALLVRWDPFLILWDRLLIEVRPHATHNTAEGFSLDDVTCPICLEYIEADSLHTTPANITSINGASGVGLRGRSPAPSVARSNSSGLHISLLLVAAETRLPSLVILLLLL